MFERNIISVEMVFLGQELSPAEGLKLFWRNLDKLPLLVKLVKMMLKTGKIKKIVGEIPRVYDKQAVADWLRKYEGFEMF